MVKRQSTKRRGPAKKGRASAHHYAGPSQHPLSGPHIENGRRHPGQKGIIVMLAKRAFDRLRPSLPFEQWRREQQTLAVGIDSLTACTQNDYLPLVAHFEGLAGHGDKQFKAAYRHLDEATRQARWLLDEALRARGLGESYAATICRTQYRRELDKATAEQLFNLRFTVEARRPVLGKQPVPQPAEADCPF